MTQNSCSEMRLIKDANFSLVAFYSAVKLKLNCVVTAWGWINVSRRICGYLRGVSRVCDCHQLCFCFLHNTLLLQSFFICFTEYIFESCFVLLYIYWEILRSAVNTKLGYFSQPTKCMCQMTDFLKKMFELMYKVKSLLSNIHHGIFKLLALNGADSQKIS